MRRRSDGSATVAVVVKGRPYQAVTADLSRASSWPTISPAPRPPRVRTHLWEAVVGAHDARRPDRVIAPGRGRGAIVTRTPLPTRPRRSTGRTATDARPDPLVLLTDVLATYRLTRLATVDVIAEPARRAVLRRTAALPADATVEEDPRVAQDVVEDLEEPPRLATLVTCRWCAGVWIAAGVSVARLVAPAVWDPVARGLALSAGAVLLARLEDD
jgi:hypothetical protein